LAAPISLRLADLADIEFAYEVACRAIRPYAEQTFGIWQEAQVRSTLASNISAGITKIIVAGGKPVGTLSVRELDDHIQLDQLFLLPEYQRNGIGTALVQEILLRARQLQVPCAFAYCASIRLSASTKDWVSRLRRRNPNGSTCKVRPNPSLHPTFNSRLRRLLPAGELKR
jgi:GNAT superfamily N-acetyltransferase